jgi:hypothetical protein
VRIGPFPGQSSIGFHYGLGITQNTDGTVHERRYALPIILGHGFGKVGFGLLKGRSWEEGKCLECGGFREETGGDPLLVELNLAALYPRPCFEAQHFQGPAVGISKMQGNMAHQHSLVQAHFIKLCAREVAPLWEPRIIVAIAQNPLEGRIGGLLLQAVQDISDASAGESAENIVYHGAVAGQMTMGVYKTGVDMVWRRIYHCAMAGGGKSKDLFLRTHADNASL